MSNNEEIGAGAEAPAGMQAAAGLEVAAQRKREREARTDDALRDAVAARTDSDRPAAARQRRTNLGGAQLKLEVSKTIPGFHLFWENDVDARLERLLGEGFEFVTPAEVGMRNLTGRVVADTDITDRVSKYVGTTDEGKPMRAFLLKCPDDLWEDIQYCINDVADSRDRDILESANRGGDRYKPSGYDTVIKSGHR